MKFLILFIFITCMQARAEVHSQRINYTAKDAPIKNVLNAIKKQSGYVFFYSYNTLAKANPVTIRVKNASLKQALDKCFEGQPFTYKIEDKTIVILDRKASSSVNKSPLPITAVAPLRQLRVTGIVTDSTGRPIGGVSVTIVGTKQGTVTDAKGRYNIQAKTGEVLSFSYVGYRSKTFTVGDNTTINVQLIQEVSSLSDLIIVGYGTQKKSDLTGSITSIDEKELHTTVGSNIGALLQSKGAGIDIQKSNGNSHPGAVSTIRVRGTRSLSASNDPLMIVDGIPFYGSLNDINPDDITSVQILKDASATAIYGSRAANGVFLITTRHGSNSKLRVNYSGYAGISKPTGTYPLMDSKTFYTFKKWAKLNGSATGTYTGLDDPQLLEDVFTDAEELEGYNGGVNTDWQNLLYKTSLLTNHVISFSGGSDKTQFASSLGYYSESGVFPGTSFDRVTLKMTIDHHIGQYVRIGLSSLNAYSFIKGANENPMDQALRSSPFITPYDKDGQLYGYLPGSNSQVWNPLADLVDGAIVDDQKRLSTFTSAYLEVKLLKGLKYRLNAGVQIAPESDGKFYGSATTKQMGGLSYGYNGHTSGYNYTLENVLTYDRNFGDHHLNLTGLYSLQENVTEYNQESYSDLVADYIQYHNPKYATNLSSDGYYSKWDIVSYMGRLNYSYKNRYLFTGTVRSDGSSVLAPGNKYHVFPSLALGWNINQENFLHNFKSLSNLKLRASYGKVGNAAINPYSTIGELSTRYYNFGSDNVLGVYPSSAPNPILTWEYTSTLNIGMDFGFWNNRLSGSAEYYHQYTNSLLLSQTLPATSGITNSFLNNVGKTENRGMELTLNSINLDGDGGQTLRWTTDFNIYFNRNKIKALASGAVSDPGNGWFVGKSSSAIYNYKRDGIWQNTAVDSAAAKALGLTVSGPNSVIGTVRVEDVNKDGKITADDRMVIGYTQPNFVGGITNRLAYRYFDFTVVAMFRQGGLLQSGMYAGWMNTFAGVYNNLNVPYWTPDNHENFWPKPNAALQYPQYNANLTYFSGSYLKIRTLSLGYTLPDKFLKTLNIGSCRLYAQANNPFILFSPYVDDFQGLDPETSGSLNLNTPPSWSMLFGLNVTF